MARHDRQDKFLTGPWKDGAADRYRQRRGAIRQVDGDFIHGSSQLSQAQISAFLRWSTDAHHDDFGVRNGSGVGGSRQAPGVYIFPNQFLESRFIKGRSSGQYLIHFVLVPIDAHDTMSKASETGRRHAPDITQTEYGNLRGIPGFQRQNPSVFSMT